MRRRAAILSGVLLLLAGCGVRERLNPFDPLNPSTHGRPPGFSALAGDSEVRLEWDQAAGDALTGYRIFRRGPDDSEFLPVTNTLPLNVTSLRDAPLANDRDYAYRLYFVFSSGMGDRPAEDAATPGPAVPWVVENRGTDLIQVTPDDRHLLARLGGYGGIADVAASPTNGTVWVADERLGRVVVYQPARGVTVIIPGLTLPRAVAIDPVDSTGWVCDLGQNQVDHFTARGDFASGSITPLVQPVDVAVDPHDGSVWVCELGADRVGRFDGTQMIWRQSVTAPSRVAIDSTTRDGWVTSYAQGTVTHLSLSGTVIATMGGFLSPLGVAVDPRRGRIWIADPSAGAVIALRRDGTEEFRAVGLTDAGELSVDLRTGEAWVVLAQPGQLALISPTAGVVRRLGGFDTPVAVSVDPGRR